LAVWIHTSIGQEQFDDSKVSAIESSRERSITPYIPTINVFAPKRFLVIKAACGDVVMAKDLLNYSHMSGFGRKKECCLEASGTGLQIGALGQRLGKCCLDPVLCGPKKRRTSKAANIDAVQIVG
jgi:hypothetical protein